MNSTENIEVVFRGNIFLFHAFDMGDEIFLQKIKQDPEIKCAERTWPRYFKSYHTPLTLSQPLHSSSCIGINLYHFGAVSFVYQIPIVGTLTEIRNQLNSIDEQYNDQSVSDAHGVFKNIKKYCSQPKFFHQHTSYLMIHVDPQHSDITSERLRFEYGTIIASALRFETQSISQFQINDILDSTTGCYRDDFVIIDSESAFVFDQEPEEFLDIFELANIQQLELRYFDKLLEKKLDLVYNQANQPMPFKSYLPFIGTLYDSIGELSKLKVDISVITERLGSSVKLTGEPFFSKVYDLLVGRLGIDQLRNSVDKKLAIIREVRTIYQNKIDSIREDLLSILIIILIMLELVIALVK